VRVDTVSEAGGAGPNEDWVGSGERVAVLLDGVTTRTSTGCSHGVGWYVKHLGESLIRNSDNPDIELHDSLARSIQQVADLHPQCDLDHPGTPSAAVGIVRISDQSVESLVLADVTIIAANRDSELEVLSDDRPDQIARPFQTAAWALPEGSQERDQALASAKARQLAMKNQTGGYFVASADPTVASEAITSRWPISDLESIILLSDGAVRLVDLFAATSWPGLVASVTDHGPSVAIRTLRDIERSDPNALKWPRSKKSDDATIALVTP
jgi:hypothetical protein